MSPLSPFQMSLSWPNGCWERVTDDGNRDEPHGDRPDARAQGYGDRPDYGERGRAADAAGSWWGCRAVRFSGWQKFMVGGGHRPWSRPAEASRATAAIRRRSELRRWD